MEMGRRLECSAATSRQYGCVVGEVGVVGDEDDRFGLRRLPLEKLWLNQTGAADQLSRSRAGRGGWCTSSGCTAVGSDLLELLPGGVLLAGGE
jgi:hypothetical protein